MITTPILVAALAVAVLVVLGIGVGYVVTLGVGGHGLDARLRTASYLFRYDDALEWLGVRAARRKAAVAELRANMADALEDESAAVVVARLGDPRQLARDIEAGARGPRPMLGVAVALCVGFVVTLVGIVAADAFASGVAAAADANVSVEGTSGILPGYRFEAETDEGGQIAAMSMTASLGVAVGIPLLAGVLAAAPWRAFRKERA